MSAITVGERESLESNLLTVLYIMLSNMLCRAQILFYNCAIILLLLVGLSRCPGMHAENIQCHGPQQSTHTIQCPACVQYI